MRSMASSMAASHCAGASSFVGEMDLDIGLEEVKRHANLRACERRKELANGERIRLHLQLIVLGGGGQRGAH